MGAAKDIFVIFKPDESIQESVVCLFDGFWFLNTALSAKSLN